MTHFVAQLFVTSDCSIIVLWSTSCHVEAPPACQPAQYIISLLLCTVIPKEQAVAPITSPVPKLSVTADIADRQEWTITGSRKRACAWP
jgi:hypothetical protein